MAETMLIAFRRRSAREAEESEDFRDLPLLFLRMRLAMGLPLLALPPGLPLEVRPNPKPGFEISDDVDPFRLCRLWVR